MARQTRPTRRPATRRPRSLNLRVTYRVPDAHFAAEIRQAIAQGDYEKLDEAVRFLTDSADILHVEEVTR